MKSSSGAVLPDIERHLEGQMAAQERQIVLLRFAVVVLATIAAWVLRDRLPAPAVTFGVLAAIGLYNAAFALLIGRFPAREVGVVATGLDFVAITVAVYANAGQLGGFLFYGIVILSVALRFGLAASVWASIVASFLYASVILLGSQAGPAVAWRALPTEIAYFLAMGLTGGLFSRVVIGRTLENARLQQRLEDEEATRRRGREIEFLAQATREFTASLRFDDVLEAVVDRSSEVLGDVVAVYLLHGSGAALELRSVHAADEALAERLRARAAEQPPRIGDGIAGRVLATATPVLTVEVSAGADAASDGLALIGARSHLAVPMISRGEVEGVLVSAITAGPRRFADHDLRLAEAIAERAASALENARLWADLQQQVRQMEALQRVVADITSNLALDEISEHLADALRHVFEADRSAIFLVEEGSGRPYCAAATNLSAGYLAALRDGYLGSPGGLALTGREPVLVPDARSDPRTAALHDAVRAEGFISLLALPLLYGGAAIGTMTIYHDATRRYDDAELALARTFADQTAIAISNARLFSRERRAQRVKDDFLSIVSHELRTPLTSIHGYAQLLEGRLRAAAGGASKELGHLGVIRSQTARMTRLVDDLLDVSRIDRPGGITTEPARIDLTEQLEQAVARTVRSNPERRIQLETPASLPIEADRDRIDQVLTNLLDNAVKYSPQGGPIVVRARVDGNGVRVTVADEGIGISAEHAAHVFERFYQVDGDSSRRRFGGLGLGLHITRAIVEAHGGEAWAEPNRAAGRGSVFGFWLPARAKVRGRRTSAGDPLPALGRRESSGRS